MDTSEYRITVEEHPDEAERLKVAEGLHSYNLTRINGSDYARLTIFLRDAEDVVVGGILGEMYWGWLHLHVLWIDDALRHRGFGARLLTAAEREATAKGCRAVYFDTFSFQALPMYLKFGYEVFGQLEDFPPGQTRYFIKKRLES